MQYVLPYLLLVVGFAALIKGADLFVDGSCSIARKLRIPDIIVGLTVVAMGTSMPELSVSVSAAILPFALAFAGGTMLYVISDEMIPETHAHGGERGATYALLVGFCVMMVMDVLLG
jgi:zinc transporter ZupT